MNDWGRLPEDAVGKDEAAARGGARLRRLRRRALVMSIVIPFLGVFLAWLLADDLAYFFENRQPRHLGRAEELGPEAIERNRFVELGGLARDMCIRAELLFGPVGYAFFLGSDAAVRILLERPAAAKEEPCQGGIEGSWRGRLLEITGTRRYRPVVDFYRSHFSSAPGQGPLYLLRAGQEPGDSWWAAALAAAVLLLWLWSLWLWIRLRRTAAVAEGEQS